MALTTCKNRECDRVLDVPEIPRSWRTPDGVCAGCAGLTPEQIMELPQKVIHAFKRPEPTGGIKLERVAPPSGRVGGRKPDTIAMPFDLLRAPGADGLVDSFLVPYGNMTPQKMAQRVAKRLSYWVKTNPGNGKIISRRSDAENGVRVYRVE